MPAEHVPELTIYDRARRQDAFAARLKAADAASHDACARSLPEAIGAENMIVQAQIALRCEQKGYARSLLLLARDRIDAAIKPLP